MFVAFTPLSIGTSWYAFRPARDRAFAVGAALLVVTFFGMLPVRRP